YENLNLVFVGAHSGPLVVDLELSVRGSCRVLRGSAWIGHLGADHGKVAAVGGHHPDVAGVLTGHLVRGKRPGRGGTRRVRHRHCVINVRHGVLLVVGAAGGGEGTIFSGQRRARASMRAVLPARYDFATVGPRDSAPRTTADRSCAA